MPFPYISLGAQHLRALLQLDGVQHPHGTFMLGISGCAARANPGPVAQQRTNKSEHWDALRIRREFRLAARQRSSKQRLWPLLCVQPPSSRCCCAGSAPLPTLL